jgi:NAD(P)-dependent dehydrogenase (short-subunit alcohol dehydrogenase family)
MRFGGKAAVVTGAASGLGRAIAAGFAREGVKTVFLLDLNEEALAAAHAEIGSAAVPLMCDVSSEESTALAWREIAACSASVDILVTSAGILGPTGSPANCDVAAWDRLYAVNVRGTFLAVRQAVPMMRNAGKGVIVTIGSTAGLAGSATLGSYSSTKGAVVMMTRSLALAHAADGIRVNCVCPGSIETSMLAATFESAGSPEAQARRRSDYLARIPVARFGQPDEIAEAVLYLASDAAVFVTGVALPVDGGRLA